MGQKVLMLIYPNGMGVQNMDKMFTKAISFNVNISKRMFQTVIQCEGMFFEATKFNQNLQKMYLML